jgi:hypothetical protein
MLRHDGDVEIENNYVTITFVQVWCIAGIWIGAEPEYAQKIRLFLMVRRWPNHFLPSVSNLHFGRICPNYGRL